MSRRFRAFVQASLVCLSVGPFLAVAPGVLDASRAQQRKAAAAPSVSSTPLLARQAIDLRLPLLSSHPQPTR